MNRCSFRGWANTSNHLRSRAPTQPIIRFGTGICLLHIFCDNKEQNTLSPKAWTRGKSLDSLESRCFRVVLMLLFVLTVDTWLVVSVCLRLGFLAVCSLLATYHQKSLLSPDFVLRSAAFQLINLEFEPRFIKKEKKCVRQKEKYEFHFQQNTIQSKNKILRLIQSFKIDQCKMLIV